MGYIEDNLIPGEKVLLRAYPHWAVFIVPFVPPATVFVLVVVYSRSDFAPYMALLGLVLFGLALLEAVRIGVVFFTTEFAVTDRRIIAKTGLLSRASLELQLAKVESLQIMQPLMGRLFDYGTVTVVGTGGTRQAFRFIGHPNALRMRVNAKLAELK